MAEKSVDEGFDNDVYTALEAKIKEMTEQVTRIESNEKAAALLAIPVPSQGTHVASHPSTPKVPAQARKRYSRLLAFKDKPGENGGIIRAEDEAYAVGMWMKATLFRHAGAEEWVKENGMAITKAAAEGVDSAGGYPCS